MSATKLKKGDTVRVIAGRNKDSEGKIIEIDREKGRVVIEGVNMITKHEKPSMRNQNGGIVQIEAPIDASNVMLLYKNKPTRVGYKVEKNEAGKVVKKTRIAKSTGDEIDVVFDKTKK
ncbi:MAG: 50S ribosomal protein L24 [Lachnospiraceae bacterium]|nr:50S ribosomal protein L24 [Lachnospiraceae bacterium]